MRPTEKENATYDLKGVVFSDETLETLSWINDPDPLEMKSAIAITSLKMHNLKDFTPDPNLCYLLQLMYEYYDSLAKINNKNKEVKNEK